MTFVWIDFWYFISTKYQSALPSIHTVLHEYCIFRRIITKNMTAEERARQQETITNKSIWSNEFSSDPNKVTCSKIKWNRNSLLVHAMNQTKNMLEHRISSQTYSFSTLKKISRLTFIITLKYTNNDIKKPLNDEAVTSLVKSFFNVFLVWEYYWATVCVNWTGKTETEAYISCPS